MSEETSAPAGSGATGDQLRLWQVTEAMRQGEMMLEQQHAFLVTLETRAGHVLGWAVSIVIACVGAQALPTAWMSHAALAVGLCALAASWHAMAVLRPSRWTPRGLEPDRVITEDFESEFMQRWSLALGLEKAVEKNSARLCAAGASLWNAQTFLALAPLLGGFTALISRANP